MGEGTPDCVWDWMSEPQGGRAGRTGQELRVERKALGLRKNASAMYGFQFGTLGCCELVLILN